MRALFANAREAFIRDAHTRRSERKDFSAWHRGRPVYGLWAIDTDTAAFRELMVTAGEYLGPVLLGDYFRQPHVTLAVCGFPRRNAVLPDDFSVRDLEKQIQRLRGLKLSPFEIESGALASFAGVPFVEIHDPSGSLLRINAALESRSRDDGPFVPHLTVGLYNAEYSSQSILARTDAFRPRRIVLQVDRLAFMLYEAAVIGGPLWTAAEFHIETGEVRWHVASPFIEPEA